MCIRDSPRPVREHSRAEDVGDEPLLIARATDLPVWVFPDRVLCAQTLLASHPGCNVIVCDDGLQHYRLRRDIEIIVFDTRMGGNGFLLPAGPLREPMTRRRDATLINDPNYRATPDRPNVFGMRLELQDAYKSVYEAVIHGGVANDCGVEIERVEAEDIEKNGAAKVLKGYGGILVPGGFGERGTEGKILAAQYARENNVPYFGLCLGMQIATIEFARNVLNLEGAHSVEFDADTRHPVIALLDEQQNVTDKGGTMRLGSQPCKLTPDSLAAKLYGSEEIHERHRHRYEFNNAYREQFESAGLVFSGQSPDGGLVEIVEVPDHSFYLASQFHPEFKSKPNEPHPLFQGFIAAAHACDHNKNV